MNPVSGARRRRRGAVVVTAVAALLALALALAACGGGSETTGSVDESGGAAPSSDSPVIGYNESLTADNTGDDALIADSGASFVRVPLTWPTCLLYTSDAADE